MHVTASGPVKSLMFQWLHSRRDINHGCSWVCSVRQRIPLGPTVWPPFLGQEEVVGHISRVPDCNCEEQAVTASPGQTADGAPSGEGSAGAVTSGDLLHQSVTAKHYVMFSTRRDDSSSFSLYKPPTSHEFVYRSPHRGVYRTASMPGRPKRTVFIAVLVLRRLWVLKCVKMAPKNM